MSSQNLIIYKFNLLYQILEELSLDLNFNIIFVSSENSLKDQTKDLKNYLIISKKNNSNFVNQLNLDHLPMSISKLLEKINVEFMKQQFINQSKVNINQYIIDLNSREMIKENIKLKLTEKEVNTIIHLSKMKKPVSINELQKNVWSYHSNLETHTVETHIYRLRKKISSFFKDDEFILSKKNGYEIK